MSAGVNYETGQEADRKGNEGSMLAQRIPSLSKQKTQNTRVNKGKFFHCCYKHFTGPFSSCIEYSRDFRIEPIYQIACSLLFVRSLGTINEGD